VSRHLDASPFFLLYHCFILLSLTISVDDEMVRRSVVAVQ
jgi:hypothetical protein